MTVRTPTYLKSRFETGDEPTATDFQDVFDSFLPLGVTSETTLLGGLNMPFVSAARGTFTTVEATRAYITSIEATFVSAATFRTNSASIIGGTIAATSVEASFVSAATLVADTATITNAGIATANISTVSAAVATTNRLILGLQFMDTSAQTTAAAKPITSSFVQTRALTDGAVQLPNMQPGEMLYIANVVSGATGNVYAYPKNNSRIYTLADGVPQVTSALKTSLYVYVSSNVAQEYIRISYT